MRESAVERKLVNGIRKLGGMALKFVSPGHAGVPDRLVLLPGGRIIFVELKTATGRLSALQLVTHINLVELGFPVRTLHGTEEVDRFLEEVMSDAFQAIPLSTGSRTVDSGS